MTVTVQNKKPLVVPLPVRRKAGLRSGDQIEFKVSSGGVIKIVPTLPSTEYTPEIVAQLIQEAKKNPMSRRELAAENARLRAYGARQAKKAGIKEGDIPSVIHESRSRRRASESRPRYQYLHRRLRVPEGTECRPMGGRPPKDHLVVSPTILHELATA